LINNKPASLASFIHDNDDLTIEYAKKVTVQTLLTQLNKRFNYTMTVTFNGKPVTLTQQQTKIIKENVALTNETELKNGDNLILKEKSVRPFIFQDIFRFVDIDLNQIKGTYQLYCNQKPIS